MIEWIKKLFKKSNKSKNIIVKNVVKVIKERKLTEREKSLLYILEREGKNTHYKGEKIYLDDGSYHEVLGYYSYYDYDIETTKAGYVLKNLNTGFITEYSYHWGGPLFFKNKPHDWLKYLDGVDKTYYLADVNSLTNDELFTKYFSKLPKEVRRDIKLKELGI